MFIKPNALKKLMKEAFKGGGLRVAKMEGRLYLAGSYWAVECQMDRVQWSILAALIEMTGQIPEEGEKYRAEPGGNQYEEFLETKIQKDEAAEELVMTDLVIMEKYGIPVRILQNPCTGAIELVQNRIADMIDDEEAAKNQEENPDGPMLSRGGLLWENETGALLVGRCELKNKDSLLHCLEKINLLEENSEKT